MQATQKIPFNDVGIKAFQLKKRLLAGFSSVIEHGQFLNGTENIKLQSTLKDFFHVPYINLVASGHDALLLSIQALHLVPDDEVIIPANAYPTAFPIVLSRVKVRLCDVDENGQINIDCLKKSITKKTKAIVLVHMFGLTTKVDEIVRIAQRNNVYLVEDCAQAFGTKYKKRFVGTYGDIACLSFYPTKTLGTLGDGGAVITKHNNIAKFINQAKAYGEVLRYKSEFVSGHSRLPELQAATLNVYFETIHDDVVKRKNIFDYYQKIIHSKLDAKIRVLTSHPFSHPVPHLFVVEGKKRNELAMFLAKSGIEIHIHYPRPIHLVKAFSYLNYKYGDFPVAERLSENMLSLPFHSYITRNQIDFIINKIQEFYEKAF